MALDFFLWHNLLGTWRVDFWCILGFAGMGGGVVTAVVGGC